MGKALVHSSMLTRCNLLGSSMLHVSRPICTMICRAHCALPKDVALRSTGTSLSQRLTSRHSMSNVLPDWLRKLSRADSFLLSGRSWQYVGGPAETLRN